MRSLKLLNSLITAATLDKEIIVSKTSNISSNLNGVSFDNADQFNWNFKH